MSGIGGDLTAQPLGPGHSFNWVWLIELIVAGILVLFFLFYFNRLFATLVSYGIRAYTWHKFRVYVDVQSLQISLLGGRVFFKGVRYHGKNETILIQHGYITWQYWLHSVKQVDVTRFTAARHSVSPSNEAEKEALGEATQSPSEAEGGGVQSVRDLPCRIAISVSGLEWFVYNRSPLYDAIAENVARSEQSQPQGAGDTTHLRSSGVNTGPAANAAERRSRRATDDGSKLTSSEKQSTDVTPIRREKSQQPMTYQPSDELRSADTASTNSSEIQVVSIDNSPSPLLRLLPIWIECHKGAIVLGNDTTMGILTTTFDGAHGHIDAGSAGPLDLFRQIFDFEIEHPVVQMKPNPDFMHSQSVTAERHLFQADSLLRKRSKWSYDLHLEQRRRRAWHGLRNLVPYFRRSVESFHPRPPDADQDSGGLQGGGFGAPDGPWVGLDRYLEDDNQDDHAGWKHAEYAKFSTILDCPAVHMTFYWDVPGTVTQESVQSHEFEKTADINGAEPPAYGLELIIRGGTVNYGPWTDRLRVEIQDAFFPNPYRDAVVPAPLTPGSQRQSTIMKIHITIESEVCLRIPTRESSKDWQWKGRAGALGHSQALKNHKERKHFRFKKGDAGNLGPNTRPFGWLSVHVDANSTVTYEMGMVPRSTGYRNRLELDLTSTRATSSVNHTLLWRCGSQRLRCDLSNPLGWNSLHKWTFNIQSNGMELFLLRDHCILLVDLIDDFTSNSSLDFMTFIPFRYEIQLRFHDLKLYLNANDDNIIDNPCDLEDNTFLILGLEDLDGNVDIPLENFAPVKNQIHFKAEGHGMRMELVTPLWNTLHTFVSDHPVAVLKSLGLDGTYTLCTSVSPGQSDVLVLNINGLSPKVYLHGFLIRYFMKMKENYFGDSIHFKTLEEFQELLAGNAPGLQHLHAQPKNEKGLDVMLNVRADGSCALMPANIYSRKDNVRFGILLVEADMRFTNYYMDISVKSSPVEASLESLGTEEIGAYGTASNTQLFIDGVNLHGHRLFGAPPSEPVYMNNWDVDVGKIVGECSTVFVKTLAVAGKAFAFTLDDEENTLPVSTLSNIHDIVFVRAQVESISLWILIDNSALLFGAGKTNVAFNDWAGARFSEHVQVSIPGLVAAMVDRKDSLRHRSSVARPAKTYACFETSIDLKIVNRKPDAAKQRALQQHHVRLHDQRTHRADWMLHRPDDEQALTMTERFNGEPPAIAIPHLPGPASSQYLRQLGIGVDQAQKSQYRTLGRKASFLSETSLPSGSSHQNSKISGPKVPIFRRVGRHTIHHTAGGNKPSAHVENSTTRQEHVQDKVEAGPAIVTFSSPWSSPYFPMQKIIIDRSELPPLPSKADNEHQATKTNQNLEEYDRFEDERRTSHFSLLVDIRPGFTGFCTPEFFVSIAALVKQMQPNHPADFLDEIQIDSMSKILSLAKIQSKSRRRMDFKIDLPYGHLKMINHFADSDHSLLMQRDQYDIAFDQTRLTFRLQDPRGNDNEICDTAVEFLVHAEARGISAAVTGASRDKSSESASARALLRDINFQISSQRRIDTKLQVRLFEFSTWGKQITSLASLITRSTAMVERIVRGFALSGQERTLQHLIYHLTIGGTTLADPVFLTKPSYVLRGAGDHLRQNDSWKIISRLRFVYRNLPRDVQKKIVTETAGHYVEIPEDAEKHVLTSFDQWRSWDHGSVQKSFVMEKIWGRDASGLSGDRTLPHVSAEAIVGSIKLQLDPGPKQNEIAVVDVNVAVITSSGQYRDNVSDVDRKGATAIQRIAIQAYCSQFGIHLNWTLFDLVKDTTGQFQNMFSTEPQSRPSSKGRSEREIQDFTSASEVHFVFGTDIGSIIIDTINLRLLLAAERFRMSAIQSIDVLDETFSLSVASTSALARVMEFNDTFMVWKLSSPAVHAALMPNDKHVSKKKALKLGAVCDRIRFSLKQDVVKLLSAVRKVIDDEVELVHDFVTDVTQHHAGSAGSQPTTTMPVGVEFHVALFLHDYKIKFLLLPALAYSISGKVVRTAVKPDRNSNVLVDLDIKHHTHAFVSDKGHGQGHFATLDVPPINARLFLIDKPSMMGVKVEITFEKIEVDATAVRSCVDIISRPGVVQAFLKAKNSAQNAADQLKKIFATSETSPSAPVEVRMFWYSASLTLLGLVIHSSAPGPKPADYRANLDLMVGLTVAHIHNRTESEDVVHLHPQFDVYFKEIGLQISRHSDATETNYGMLKFTAHVQGRTETDSEANKVQRYAASSGGLSVELYQETASLVITIVTFLQERIKTLKIPQEVKDIRPLRRLTLAALPERPLVDVPMNTTDTASSETGTGVFFDSIYSLELGSIQVRWNVSSDDPISPGRENEDLIFSINNIDLSTKREGSARLAITNLQLQMVPKSADPHERSSNSALLPEVVFNVAHVSTKQDRRFAFQAAGKVLDLRLASDFIVPASVLQLSLGTASKDLRDANSLWASDSTPERPQTTTFLGNKRLASLLVDADFAGATVNVQPRKENENRGSIISIVKDSKWPRTGRYGQVVHGDQAVEATLRTPGIAFKIEYKDTGKDDPSLGAEIKVAASSNVLYPSVVPLIIEVSSSIREIVGDPDPSSASAPEKPQTTSYLTDASLSSSDPATILGRCKLNLALWIREQEFSLSCQPIARVAATARFESIFVTINTVQSPAQGRFFALLMTFNNLSTSVQHVYSRESTASFDVDSIVASIMNSKHVTAKTGISAILNISPMNMAVNAKQLQDFFLFREIWYPEELRQASPAAPTAKPAKNEDSQAYIVQRYQQVAAASAFSWNAVISLQQLKVELDLGQGLGKSLFEISKLWASSKKSSDWEQNLCIGFEKVGVVSTGRMSGFVELQNFRVRTSIRWPAMENAFQQTPLIQASLSFDELRVKAAFDYQPFAVADISTLEFLMYNVRPSRKGERDRLVGILDGGKVQVFCTTSSAAQAIALYQAIERLTQEKQAAYQASLKELDRFLKRKSVFPSSTWTDTSTNAASEIEEETRSVISLQTDVVITLSSLNIGAFPGTFFDTQILKVEATDAQARFAVSASANKTRSSLGLNLGQLRVALANVSRANTQALGEVSVDDVISRATGSRGGTILKVPKVVVGMQTWQSMESNIIEYIFKSIFEGKIDVGWNYSRISFIRGMWSAHARALAHRLGKPIQQSAVKITTEPQLDDMGGQSQGQEKITAVVNVPQSRFEYVALEPPIIDTPQLRDLGEATPSLEWIGLHRDRLPNVTHQIIIVSLLEVAKEVEDAYSKILGST